jgi:hypothetical protein
LAWRAPRARGKLMSGKRDQGDTGGAVSRTTPPGPSSGRRRGQIIEAGSATAAAHRLDAISRMIGASDHGRCLASLPGSSGVNRRPCTTVPHRSAGAATAPIHGRHLANDLFEPEDGKDDIAAIDQLGMLSDSFGGKAVCHSTGLFHGLDARAVRESAPAHLIIEPGKLPGQQATREPHPTEDALTGQRCHLPPALVERLVCPPAGAGRCVD